MVNSSNAFLPEPTFNRKKGSVKVATPDILLDDPKVSVESMTDYVFASIGGTEILASSRTDMIDSPLNNGYTLLRKTGDQFSSPEGIVPFDTIDNTFNTYSIDINNHLPTDSSSPISISSDGTVTISLNALKSNYVVEVNVHSSGRDIIVA